MAKQTTNANEFAAISKDLVTKSRHWATTVRDMTWQPWLGLIERNEPVASMWRPVWDMTRTAHDRWLELYETQAHEMIDRSFDMFDRFKG